MAAGGETFVCGAYTATWNSVTLGIFEGDASLPTLEYQAKAEDIANTSAYGKTTIDGVYQGIDVFIAMVCLEYKSGPIAAFYPWSTLGLLGVIGRLLYGISQALVLTAVAGTPAAASPATLTASKTILLPGFTPRLAYGPTLRKIPLRLRAFPYDTGGAVYGHWTQT